MSRLRTSRTRVVLASAVLTCFVSASLADPRTVTDASGQSVEIANTAQVVSVGGSVTEILYALGLDDHIVAVDTTSLFPPRALADKPNVGYMRALSPEGILAMRPSLVLAEDDAGPQEALALLRSASVPLVLVPGNPDPQGVVEKIRFVADVMGVSAAGQAIADGVAADLGTIAAHAGTHSPRTRVLFLLSLANGRMIAAGEGTSAAAMIELAGAQNALSGFSGYKPVGDESVIEAAPEVIVMMARSDHAATADEVFSHPALSRTPAAADRRLVAMDGLYLIGFGPRVAQAVRDLAAAIYPDAPPIELPDRPWTGDRQADGHGQ